MGGNGGGDVWLEIVVVGGRLVESGNEAAGQLGWKSTHNLLKLFHNFNRISRFCIIYFYIL